MHSPGFVFAVKASRYLTHIKKTPGARRAASPSSLAFGRVGGKARPDPLPVSPELDLDLTRLESFLKLLPGDVRGAFEFRNDSWHNDETWAMLSKYRAAYCIMDSPGLPLHLKTTADFSYVRMHSGGEETSGNYTDEHLRTWADRIEKLLLLGDAYVYFNNDYMGFAVNNAFMLKSLVVGGN